MSLDYVEKSITRHPDGTVTETFMIHGGNHENLKALDVAGKALDLAKPTP